MPPGYAIVVDTSIARAAGGLAATDPGSIACRDTLFAIRGNDHQVVMSWPIRNEWLGREDQTENGERAGHASRFAVTWLTSMQSSGKVKTLGDPIDQDLRDEVSSLLSKDATMAVKKDMALIEVALASDRRILSLNDRHRKHFQSAARQAHSGRPVVLRNIMWSNPTREDERVLTWLADGAPEEPQRYLEYYHGGSE